MCSTAGDILKNSFIHVYCPPPPPPPTPTPHSQRGRIGTRFLRPRGTSPLKGANPAGTRGYRNGTESFFGLKGCPSVVCGKHKFTTNPSFG